MIQRQKVKNNMLNENNHIIKLKKIKRKKKKPKIKEEICRRKLIN